jgi:hypothetical protein
MGGYEPRGDAPSIDTRSTCPNLGIYDIARPRQVKPTFRIIKTSLQAGELIPTGEEDTSSWKSGYIKLMKRIELFLCKRLPPHAQWYRCTRTHACLKDPREIQTQLLLRNQFQEGPTYNWLRTNSSSASKPLGDNKND